MTAPAQQLSLPDRWAAAAAGDPSTDQPLLRLIESCRTGASINEAALLKVIVQHANEIATGDVPAASATTASASVEGANA